MRVVPHCVFACAIASYGTQVVTHQRTCVGACWNDVAEVVSCDVFFILGKETYMLLGPFWAVLSLNTGVAYVTTPRCSVDGECI